MNRVVSSAAVFSLCTALLLTDSSRGATYYVSPSGSSMNEGSATSPWREVRDAVPHLVPGDTVLVQDGVYLGFTIDGVHGSSGLPIIIQAVGPSAVFTVTSDRTDNRDTIQIRNSSYVEIDGLRAFNALRAAVSVELSHHVAVRNGVFGDNTTWGIHSSFTDDLALEWNIVYGSVQGDGICLSGGCVNPILRLNRTYDNQASGVRFDGASSQGGTGLIIGALVEKNFVFRNGGTAAVSLDGVRNSTVRNNLVFNNVADGIALFRTNGAFGPSGIEVYYNTVDVASNATWALAIRQSDADAGPIRVRNNVFTGGGGLRFGSSTDVANTDSDFNVLARITPDDGATVVSLGLWRAQGYEANSLSASGGSLFLNPSAGDYRLKPNARALGAGQPVPSVYTDIDGAWRSPDGPIDLGCYQTVVMIPGPRANYQGSSAARK